MSTQESNPTERRAAYAAHATLNQLVTQEQEKGRKIVKVEFMKERRAQPRTNPQDEVMALLQRQGRQAPRVPPKPR